MDLEKFQNDVNKMTKKLSKNLKDSDVSRLNHVRQQLIEMYKKNLVKINHSILELVCASSLISKGYAVDVEKDISDILVCDIFAKKGGGNTIVEIETGFTPPDHALDTIDYFTARIMSKIARYSQPWQLLLLESCQFQKFSYCLQMPEIKKMYKKSKIFVIVITKTPQSNTTIS
jgi:hypothetical protein